MVDKSKRRTLKLISGAGTAALGSVAVGRAAFADYQKAPADLEQPTSDDACNQLQIQIITGRSTSEDTVIFTNSTDTDVTVDKFLPGFVTLGNHMMDLNALTKDRALIVKPGYPLSSNLARWEILGLNQNDSYLWCDAAAEAFQMHQPDNAANANVAGVININAAVLNGRALLTLEHTASNPVLS